MPAKLAPDRQRGLIVAVGDLRSDGGRMPLFSRLLAQVSPQPRVVVLVTADLAEDDGDLDTVLLGAGAGDVRRQVLQARADSEQRALLDAVEHAQVVLLHATQALRLSTLVGGTSLARAIRRRNAEGMAVLGCEAGAALLCEHMLAHGAEEGATPRRGGASLAPGLGLTNRIVIDQGGHASDRLGRLLAALALNPFALGLGLDTGTAAVIGADNVLEVVGSGGATLIDPAEMHDSNAAELEHGAPIRITNLRLHALTGGARYDLDFRRTVD
ncbi:cyanophycinase [Dokdonella sp.]|uniref:cyanophycinase n=1 Tax=Dokdonella sp. TaxID=2291710 RepID=UPI002619FDF9|nr:cyanophycinase [Dokdonella sp.]